MKKLTYFVLLLSTLTLVHAQWEIVHQNKWGYFTSLDLVNDNLGFITTEDGYIFRTTDKGINWNQFNKLNWTLSDIQFVDEKNGWLIGRNYDEPSSDPFSPDSMRLLRTEDGGQTWIALNNDIEYFGKYQFITPAKGWAIKFTKSFYDSKLIYSLDGGESWYDVDMIEGLASTITYFRFVNEEIGWAIGGKDLYRTDDGGISWTRYSYQNEIESIIPASDSVCYVFFDDSVYKTVNSGSNWIIYPCPQELGIMRGIKSWGSINDSTFILTASGMLHAPDVIYKTNNGFKSIEVLHEFQGLGGSGIGSFWAPSYVELFDSKNGVAINNSYILKTSNQGKNWDIISVYRNFWQQCFVNEQIGYVIGDDGYLLKTDNGGKNWNSIFISDSEWVRNLNFINKDTGFVGGRRLYKTVDGGNSWEVTNDVSVNYIYFLDNKNGWALSNNIYHTIDCGENWEKASLGFRGHFHSIDFADINHGFAVGYNSDHDRPMVAKSNNAGITWDYVLTGWSYSFTDIDQVTSRLGFACGGQVIICSKDGWSELSNWEKQYEKAHSNLNSLHMIDSLTGYCCGDYYNEYSGEIHGFILKTEDGGENWEENFSIIDIELYDLQFIDENNGWAVGENGIVLHTTNGGLTWVGNEQELIPSKIVLFQNYPNPFNPTTRINYSIIKQSNVTLKVFDLLGSEVATLVDKDHSQGNYEVEFDGSELTSGIYFYRLNAGDYSETKKMILLK